MAATKLWKSKSAADWHTVWGRYPAVVAALQKDKLEELDAWFQTTLPEILHKRDPKPFISQKELVKLMEWKLKKGKWRPQLMKYIESLSADAVQNASEKAFKELAGGKVKSAIEALAELKGVGPATASAVLAAYDTNVPFMGDEALEAIAHIIGARKYTLGHYMLFTVQLEEKAKWLNQQKSEDEDEDEADVDEKDTQWTAQKVQLCLYAAAHDSATDSTKAKAGKAAASASKPKAKVKAKNAKRSAPESEPEEESQPTRTRRRTATQ